MSSRRRILTLRCLPTVLVAVVAALLFDSCRIEPPLHLADTQKIEFALPEIVTDINTVWGDDEERDEWWYGWDDGDIRAFGSLEYPAPQSYELRLFYLGAQPDSEWQLRDAFTVDGSHFVRNYYFGYYDMLAWSNIVSSTGSQVLLIDESDPGNVMATTTETRLRMGAPMREPLRVFNGPEPFFAGLLPNLHVSKDPADYDYFDESRNVWVKNVTTEVYPMVYTYLVQVVIYNNRGRISGITDRTAVTSLARNASVHTGYTSEEDAILCFDMRMKPNLPARNGRKADILGGKLTTFGLCGMKPWIRSRAEHRYTGTRTDLLNKLMLSLHFKNDTDSVFEYDVTPQMRRQAHGGVITIEIDADTISIPVRPGSSGPSAGFDPTINEYTDSITYNFEL